MRFSSGCAVTEEVPAHIPPWLEERIDRQMREGVTLSVRWWLWGTGRRHRSDVAAIHWRPGEDNALARIIIKHVRAKPMPLSLDGRLFMVQRVEEWPEGWNEHT